MLEVSAEGRFSSEKIVSSKDAHARIKKLKKEGKDVGLCHGGFDLTHPGHVIHFESAKRLCDVLVVSVTSDRFVSERKGSGRPIYSEHLRAYMAASLQCVDMVVISDFKTGNEVIEALEPTQYIKGPDYIKKNTPGIESERKTISAIGGKMVYTDDPKLSTTEIIEYIKMHVR